jgi:hypothetical protein
MRELVGRRKNERLHKGKCRTKQGLPVSLVRFLAIVYACARKSLVATSAPKGTHFAYYTAPKGTHFGYYTLLRRSRAI